MDERLHEQLREVGAAHWWYEGRRRILTSVLDEKLDPSSDRRLLEVGCGSGAMLAMLQRFGTVEAIEPDPGAVAHCQQQLSAVATVVEGSVPGDLRPGADYDVVAAFDVLEHLEDDAAGLRAIRETLRPGGWLVATVPAFPSLWGRQDELSHHFRRYRRRGLERLASGAGFEIERLTYFNTILFPPIAIIRLAHRVVRRFRRAKGERPLDRSDFDTGPGRSRLGGVLARLFGLERHVLRRADLPVGVSLLLVARRPAS
jgi:SAM-dependent methyltransferase